MNVVSKWPLTKALRLLSGIARTHEPVPTISVNTQTTHCVMVRPSMVARGAIVLPNNVARQNPTSPAAAVTTTPRPTTPHCASAPCRPAAPSQRQA